MQPRPIRVLVVDDSLVMPSLLRMVLASEPAIELVGMAAPPAPPEPTEDQLEVLLQALSPAERTHQ